MARSHKSHADAIIFTALPLESEAVCKHLFNVGDEQHSKGNIYQVGAFSASQHSRIVAVVEVGKGNVEAAAGVERAITHFNPDLALLVGVAGGVKDVNLRDVVVADKVYQYESGKAANVFEPRPKAENPDDVLVQRAKAEARRSDWKKRLPDSVPSAHVHFGPIASGEMVVASRDSEVFSRISFLYGDALAVDMESYGFLKTARKNHVSALVVRGISDQIDNKSEADRAGSQEIAAQIASAFAFQVLAKADMGKSRPKNRQKPRRTMVVSNPNFAGYTAILGRNLEIMGQRVMEKRGDRRTLEVSIEIGISRSTLSRVERGFRPDIETFGKVCRWLKADPGEILAVQPVPRPRLIQRKRNRSR
jgi:nucleoside phosphorylase